MTNKKIFYIVKSVWIVIILMIGLVFMNRDVSTTSAKKKTEEETTRLNIALVNEDTGVSRKDTEYDLGGNYVKKVEKDSTYNWFIVSRGIAENGLKNGTYNLLVTIPSNFSTTILGIDEVVPEKMNINYKVNANGNVTLENESRSVGRKITSELNQQLVDVYVASIIDNFYTAQRNVEKSYSNQTNSVGTFDSVLYQPTIDFKQNFPMLSSNSQSALQANDTLQSSLTSSKESANALFTSQQDYSSVLEKLLAQRADGKLTYEEFVTTLMTLDETLLSSETASLFQKVSESNQYFQTQFGSETEGEYFAQASILDEQLNLSKEQIATQKRALENLRDSFFETYKERFFKSFGKNSSTDSEILLKDVVELKGLDASQQYNDLETYNEKQLDKMKKLIDNLPYYGTPSTPNIFKYPNMPYGDGEPEKKIQEKITNKIIPSVDEVNKKIENANESLPDDRKLEKLSWTQEKDTSHNSYYKNLDTTYNDLVKARIKAMEGTHPLNIEWTNAKKENTITLVIPLGVEIVDKPQNVTQSASNPYCFEIQGDNQTQFDFTYKYKEDFDETSASNNFQIVVEQPVKTGTPPENSGSASGNGGSSSGGSENGSSTTNPNGSEQPTPPSLGSNGNEIKVKVSENKGSGSTTPPVENTNNQEKYSILWNQPVDVTNFLSTDYQKAKRAYAEEVGQLYELYEKVATELNEYENYPFLQFQTLLTLPLTDVFKKVIEETFSGDYEKQDAQLEKLNKQAEQLESQSSVIRQKMMVVQENTGMLNEEIKAQLTLLDQLTNKSTETMDKKSLVTTINDQTDSEVDNLSSALKTILQESDSMKQTSEMNTTEANSVKSIFDSFDKEVQNAQKNGEDLSINADVIKANLDNELKKNGDFVSAFSTVLSNTHKDGVPNNSLLQFISNPVVGKMDTAIKTTEVNKPFTWILIMYTLSLFVAYLFVAEPVTKKVKNTFKSEHKWIKDNLLETILLSVCSIFIGLIIGILSSSELSIVKESQVRWVIMVILFVWAFSLLNHYVLKQFKVAGVAISLFLFISYVFVTDAIGKASVNNPLTNMIRSINPLSIGETNLSDIMANQPLNILSIILYILCLILLFALNTFILQPRRMRKQ